MACSSTTLPQTYNVDVCTDSNNYSVFVTINIPNQAPDTMNYLARPFLERYRDGLWSAVDSKSQKMIYEGTPWNFQFDNIGYLDTPMRVRVAFWHRDGDFIKNFSTKTWTR